ncbi:hypothetical protein Tco_1400597 [Tanacetum coccineum]
MYSLKETIEFRILQGQDAIDASSGEWSNLALNKDHVFQADQCDAFGSDVDEAPTAQTMFMENLSSTDLIYDEVGPSYDTDILSKVQDHDKYLDSVDEYQEYVKKNAEQVVQSNVSSVPNDALIMIINDMHGQTVQCVSANKQDKDTLKLAERTRIGMLEKMKSPLWVEGKIKIAPPDYSKENYLAAFAPQSQLSAEHIFWSSVSKPISEMTVYPPNTPARLVPRVLPTKSQKGKGVSNKQRNVTLLSVMNAVNTVSRFFELHDAYTVGQARCLELEAEISKLKHKIEKDDHSEMIKHFSNLEIDHLNLQLKYQNLKECFGNNKSKTSQDTPEFDLFFEINKMKEQLQGKNNIIRKLKEQISHMNERRSEADCILDFKALDS